MSIAVAQATGTKWGQILLKVCLQCIPRSVKERMVRSGTSWRASEQFFQKTVPTIMSPHVINLRSREELMQASMEEMRKEF